MARDTDTAAATVRRRKAGGKERKSATSKEKGKEAVEEKMAADIQEELTQKLENLLERDRLGGDGESVPETPPNEASVPQKQTTQAKVQEAEAGNPFQLSIKLDMMALVLLVVGVFTRMLRLESP